MEGPPRAPSPHFGPRPAPLPTVRGRRSPARGLLLAALFVGCRGSSPTADGIDAPSTTAVRPTLEEIFQDPPVSGVAPRLDALSADGTWLVLRWTPPPAAGSEAIAPGADKADRRLLSVVDPGATGHRGRPLDELLPAEEGAGEISAAVWSHHGHLLALARGRRLWLYHPAAGHLQELLDRGEADPAGTPPDARKPGAEEEAAEKPGPLTGLAFSRNDALLHFFRDGELYLLPLPEQEEPSPLHLLSDLPCMSEGVTAPADRLQWSEDYRTVFGTDPLPGDPASPAPEPAGDDPPAPGPPRQVLHLDDRRAVELVGMAEIASLEEARLSPDGRFVFAEEVDRTAEPAPTLVPDYLTERVTTRESRRRLADDLPAPTRVWVWDTADGARQELAPLDPSTPPDTTAAHRGVRPLGWAPQPTPGSPARFAFQIVSADHRDTEIWCWTAGTCTRVWTEHDDRWVGGPARRPRWSPDGTRLFLGSESRSDSTTPGRAQLFAIDVVNGEISQLTEVEGELSHFDVLPGGGVLVQASRTHPGRRALGRLSAAAVRGAGSSARPPRVEWYPAPPGWNAEAAASRDGERLVFRHETLGVPGELHVAEGEDSHPLTRTVPPAFTAIPWIRPVLFRVESADGAEVRAHVFLPPGVELDAAAPRASIVFVHGAGYLQNVTDSMTSYPLNLMFHSRLARMGYPVIDVDYRGSAGYGRDFRTDVQYHLGGKDLDDIHLVVDALVARGLVDRERVGIYGGSYGGFLTLMALFTAPERWAVGAALRAVSDWRTYSPGYTQPRLGRPSTHPEAYARSSPIDLAAGLEDPLYILHGLVDSNVFAQDSIRLIERLIDLGRDFEAMLYPSQGHGFDDGAHWLDEYHRIEEHLVRHLGPPLRSPKASDHR